VYYIFAISSTGNYLKFAKKFGVHIIVEEGGVAMSILIAMFSIIVVAVVLIVLSHLRHMSRQQQQVFSVESTPFYITIRVSRIFWLITLSIETRPRNRLPVCPPISCNITKNGKPILKIPNFWTNRSSFALTRLSKTDNLTLHMKIKTSGKNNEYSFQMFDKTI